MAIPHPEEKERSVQAMFDSIARRYDLNNTLLSLGLHHRWKESAVEQTQLNPGDIALDLCAGTGDLAVRLAQKKINAPGRVVAVDLNFRMLSIGRAKSQKGGFTDRISCIRANAECLPFDDQTFHAVTIAFGIRNVADIKKGLSEIFRVLRPQGQLVCLEFSRPPNPILRKLYALYSHYWLPWIGSLISGDRTGTYRYLPASIQAFPDQKNLADLLVQIGFQRVTYRNLAGGIVAIHIGTKGLHSK